MDVTAIRTAVPPGTLLSVLGLAAVVFALYLALSKSLVLILFFGLCAASLGLLVADQLRRSLYQIRYE